MLYVPLNPFNHILNNSEKYKKIQAVYLSEHTVLSLLI